ncbi:MAG: hypothetical protein CL904_06975 [Dehalococcoidia bacterium]|nr:hypothetical protein [Dehalococcoidia bacterium]MQG16130.1 PIG-L family deacetylase [SAR202 cluster bacterium]|tara:strand:- start:1274 stop:2005 length:732 start_codon:yes stop_codon:yes gene_type:complete
MNKTNRYENKSILGIFAHPDDETSGAGCTFTKFARMGAKITVITATRGELGTLGTGNLSVTREQLPAVREGELRKVLSLFGAKPPILLGYKDQEVQLERTAVISDKLLHYMKFIEPDVVVTFGPQGISKHSDHIAIHKGAIDAFNNYKFEVSKTVNLLYIAIPELVAKEFNLDIDGPETQPNIYMPAREYLDVKIKALRTYKSQEDAQEFAEWLENSTQYHETFKVVGLDADQSLLFEELLDG